MNPTITRRRPAATSASTIRSHASLVLASGFSQKTCLLAAIVHPHLTGQALADRLRSIHVHIGNGGDPGAGQHLREPADVVLPDHSDADDADVDCHGNPLSGVDGRLVR